MPNSNLFTHRLLFFSREATSETYGPRVFFLIYLLAIYFSFAFLFRSIKPKIQIHFGTIYFIGDLLFQSTTIFWHRYPKGIDNPLACRVARCYYLCAGVVYVVLLGCPTGSITLVSSLREIPNVTVLHHPFCFGEIPT